ncbi:MAG: peptidoglycan-binding domain 1 protein, general secretion pathway protein A [candidate division NC10 bacterium CSP1-5]|nr:MAG: peptidoglycan-binding domain 1 protein, general secretion pathway protein A [candidate division NC10 bacterium CSP1-5]
MYEQYFGLKEKPFSLTPDPRFLFLSADHRGALDHLLYGIQRREGFLAITGDIGTGKTTICRVLLERLDPGVQTALILNPLLNEREILSAILEDFGITYPGQPPRKTLIDLLNLFLLDQAKSGGAAILIIDEAQNLAPNVLEQIRILSNLETDQQKLLQIILVGQRELREKLESKALRQLNQRISIRYHLAPLSAEETVRYIEHRLTVAGARGGIDFTPGAYQAIYHFSRGVPRLINLIADRALLAGYVAGSSYITKEMVSEGRQSIDGHGVRARASFRFAMGRYLQAPRIALALSFLFGALFTALLSGLIGFEASWSTISARLPFRLQAPPEVAPAAGKASVAGGVTLPILHSDPAFRYSVWAWASQEGEPFRKMVQDLEAEGLRVSVGQGPQENGIGPSLLVGRFKTREEADDALKRMQMVEGIQRLEVVEISSTSRQEGR